MFDVDTTAFGMDCRQIPTKRLRPIYGRDEMMQPNLTTCG